SSSNAAAATVDAPSLHDAPPISTNGALTIQDADQGQATFVAQAGTAGSNGYGTFSLDAAGHWTYSASNTQAAIQQLGAGETLTERVEPMSSDRRWTQTITATACG